jgi:transposase
MMGRRERGQGQFFYAFDLDKVVPADHLVRQIDGVLDLDWVHKELAPYYSHTGRPSIDPALMIRMLLVGYMFAIRSERRLCSEVQVNLAYRWFCKLGIEDGIPDHSVSFLFDRLYSLDNEGAVVGTKKSMTGCILVSSVMVISFSGFNRWKFQDYRPLDGRPL